jgi:F0F1-type ATP synthase membrane subunit a
MFPLFFGNLGAGEIIIIALLVVLPIVLLLRAVIRWLDRH